MLRVIVIVIDNGYYGMHADGISNNSKTYRPYKKYYDFSRNLIMILTGRSQIVKSYEKQTKFKIFKLNISMLIFRVHIVIYIGYNGIMMSCMMTSTDEELYCFRSKRVLHCCFFMVNLTKCMISINGMHVNKISNNFKT